MHLHYLTLGRQAAFLNGQLHGQKIVASYTQRRNEWMLICRGYGQSEGCLQLSCDGRFPYALWLENPHRSKISTDVLPEVVGLQIAGVAIIPGERILKLWFRQADLVLILQFFTGRSNFFLIDDTRTIRNSFKAAKKLTGEKFEIPPTSDRLNPFQMTAHDFLALIAEQENGTVEALLKQIRFLNRTVIREVLFRSQIDADHPLKKVTPVQKTAVWEQLQQFLQACQDDAPRVYFKGEIPERFALTELRHLAHLPCREFSEVNEALRFFCFQVSKYQNLIQRKRQYSSVLERKIRAIRHHLLQLQNRRPDPEKARHLQKCGELLTAQPHLLKPGMDRVTVVDYFDPELKKIEIKVNPQLSAQENAALYFRRARQLQEKHQDETTRAADLTSQLEEYTRLLTECRDAENLKPLDRIGETLKSRHILQSHPTDREVFRRPFKTYTYRGWEIWVGRSARDNDALTFKFAGKEDFWLHVQGYTGSHVILRNPEQREHPPDAVWKYAAALAVTFSQAKHASYVPVLLTRVKYVRKPRKSAPGTVLPSRTKTIFVDPLNRKDIAGNEDQ